MTAPTLTFNPVSGQFDFVGVGVPGPPGPAGGTVTAIAASNINAFSVVALNSVGLAYMADKANLADANRILGIAAVSALTGGTLTVATTGILVTGAVWTPGPLFVGTAGALTSTAPSAPNYEFQVATAVSSSILIVSPQFPIFLI